MSNIDKAVESEDCAAASTVQVLLRLAGVRERANGLAVAVVLTPAKVAVASVVQALPEQQSIAARRRSVLVLARAGTERSTSAKPDSLTVRGLLL